MINIDAIMAKVKSHTNTSVGKKQMNDRIGELFNRGVGETNGGGKIITENDMDELADELITVLRNTAMSSDLPPSVARHFDSLNHEAIQVLADGRRKIDISFADDLTRKSLYDEGYPEGLKNIVALFNNGYSDGHPVNYVYGWWENHSPTGEDVSYRSGYGANDAYTRSTIVRDGLNFMNRAVDDFNGKYATKYGATAILNEEYIK